MGPYNEDMAMLDRYGMADQMPGNFTGGQPEKQGNIWGAVIAGLVSIGSAIWSSENAKKRNKEQREWNEKMLEEQRQYDSPKETRQRLLDAGLNPALMYGQGSAWANSQSPESYQPETPNSPLPSNLGEIFQNFRSEEAGISKVGKEMKFIESAANKNDMEALKAMALTNLTVSQKRDLDLLIGGRLRQQAEDLRSTQANTNYTKTKENLAQIQDFRKFVTDVKSWREMDEKLNLMIVSAQKSRAETAKIMQEKQRVMEQMRGDRLLNDRIESGTPLNPMSGLLSPLNTIYNWLTAPSKESKQNIKPLDSNYNPNWVDEFN